MNELIGDCVIWHGPVNGAGYGTRYMNGARTTLIHRQVWSQAHGPIPSGMVIRHLCNNKRCMNVAHLAVGTQSQNMGDAIRSGVISRGAARWNSRANETMVHEVRRMHSIGCSTAEISRYSGLSENAVRCIWQRKTWAHV